MSERPWYVYAAVLRESLGADGHRSYASKATALVKVHEWLEAGYFARLTGPDMYDHVFVPAGAAHA